MIQIKLILAADRISFDPLTNEISIFSIFDSLRPVGLPFFMTNLAGLAILERTATDPPNFTGTFSVRLNGTQMVESAPMNVAFQDKLSFRMVARVQGVVIPEPGNLELRFRFTPPDQEPLEDGYTIRIDPPTAQPTLFATTEGPTVGALPTPTVTPPPVRDQHEHEGE